MDLERDVIAWSAEARAGQPAHQIRMQDGARLSVGEPPERYHDVLRALQNRILVRARFARFSFAASVDVAVVQACVIHMSASPV